MIEQILGPVLGAGGLVAGILGGKEKEAAAQKALELYQQSLNEALAIGVPSVEAQQVALERLKEAGVYTPELEQAITQGETELRKISTSPGYKDAQLAALNQLRDISDAGGLTLSDKAAQEKMLGEVAARNRGAQEAILQDTRNRGVMNSGMELASRLQAQQGAAQSANQQGLDIAANAQNRALQAIMQRGQLGGQMQQQEFGQQAQVANAQDLINRFNTNQSADVQQRNIQQKNLAQQENLKNKQNIMNQNVELANKEQMHNKNLLQTNFQNQLSKQNITSAARNKVAGGETDKGNASANIYEGLGQTLTGWGGQAMGFGDVKKKA